MLDVQVAIEGEDAVDAALEHAVGDLMPACGIRDREGGRHVLCGRRAAVASMRQHQI
jgi:hypothetical protein